MFPKIEDLRVTGTVFPNLQVGEWFEAENTLCVKTNTRTALAYHYDTQVYEEIMLTATTKVKPVKIELRLIG